MNKQAQSANAFPEPLLPFLGSMSKQESDQWMRGLSEDDLTTALVLLIQESLQDPGRRPKALELMEIHLLSPTAKKKHDSIPEEEDCE